MIERNQGVSQYCLITLTLFAVCYTLHVARDILLPLLLAVIFALLLAPLVKRLERLKVHRGFAAALVVFTLVAGIAASIYYLTGPAINWLSRTPQAIENMESYISDKSTDMPSFDTANEALQALEKMTETPDKSPIARVEISQPGLTTEIWQSVRNFIIYGLLAVIMLFFMLSAGDVLFGRFVQTLPDSESRERLRSIAYAAQGKMSRYLVTITCLNLSMGMIVAASLWAIGYPDPALWGAVAAALRYLPYAGMSLMLLLLVVVGGDSIGVGWQVLAAPLSYGLISGFFGQVVEPFVHGYRFQLNPIIVCLWIFFWGWMWGAPGLLLAVPLLTLLHVVSEHFEATKKVAHIITSTQRT